MHRRREVLARAAPSEGAIVYSIVMTTIVRVHVASLGARLPPSGQLFALWPEPVNHDACFEAAGFAAFGDPDAEWDAQFEAMIDAVLGHLSALGPPSYNDPERITPTRSLVSRLLRRPAPAAPTPSQALVLAAENDQVGPIRVELGQPPAARVIASDGHPILWIWLRDDVAGMWPELCRVAAAGRPIATTELDWTRLVTFPA